MMIVGDCFLAGLGCVIGWFCCRKAHPSQPAHAHLFELIATAYAPPFERLRQGCTSFVWKCQDPTCEAVKTVRVPGKLVDPPNSWEKVK